MFHPHIRAADDIAGGAPRPLHAGLWAAGDPWLGVPRTARRAEPGTILLVAPIEAGGAILEPLALTAYGRHAEAWPLEVAQIVPLQAFGLRAQMIGQARLGLTLADAGARALRADDTPFAWEGPAASVVRVRDEIADAVARAVAATSWPAAGRPFVITGGRA